MIFILHASNPISALIHPYHDELYDVSRSARAQSLGALTDQFQRLMQAAPIPALPSIRPESQSSTSVRAWLLNVPTDRSQHLTQVAPIPAPPLTRPDFRCYGLNFAKCMFDENSGTELYCPTCEWRGNILITHVHRSTMRLMAKHHARGQSGRFQCCDCDFKEVCSGERFQRHLTDDHGCLGRDKRWLHLVRYRH